MPKTPWMTPYEFRKVDGVWQRRAVGDPKHPWLSLAVDDAPPEEEGDKARKVWRWG